MNELKNVNSKIVSKEEFIILREKLRKEGKKVGHCHGVYDLVHPGHIIHLKEAKSVCDVLAVSITAAKYVQKGPGRPYFSDEIRLNTIAAIEYVDYVILSEEITSFGMIDTIKPDLYIKGSEYAEFDKDITQNIGSEVNRVRENGGEVYFTKGEVFSSTKLLNNNFPTMSDEVKAFLKEASKEVSFDHIQNEIEKMKDIKVLVIGDIIIDEYVMCNVQGLMSKDRAFSAKYLKEERYLGGSLAIARHIANFSDNVTVCGIMGTESDLHSQILNDLSKDMFIDLLFDPNFQTVVKKRYIEKRGIRNEYDKLFSVNFLNDENEEKIDRDSFYKKLKKVVSQYDLVVLADYGNGLIDKTAMDIIQEESQFLSINCQTNSSNFGTNIITKYKKADCFTLDEREMKLALPNEKTTNKEMLKKLFEDFNAKRGWFTVGSKGVIGMDEQLNSVNCPALILTVQDTIGAGDALFALASLSAYLNLEIKESALICNAAGAIAANILGNAEAVSKVKLLKFLSTLLNI